MRYQIGLGTILSALLLTLMPVSATAAPGGTNNGRGEENRSQRAQAALAQAKGLFQDKGRASGQDDRLARRAPGQSHKDATLVLRDLALSLDDLDAEDRKVARSILARPTDYKDDPWQNGYERGVSTAHTCSESADICVHWVDNAKSIHAPNLADQDGDGIPDWVMQNQRVFEEVWDRIVVQLGYRAPLPDDAAQNHGPDGRTDIYLAELRRHGMYGYCAVDDMDADQAAYCVVDNDFVDFAASPEQSLRVTAAHEFFHAVQFAYRVDADYWVMEGTAAWIEDEVYDGINDNLQYLKLSALRFPAAPLDYIDPENLNWVYGSWIWWRFLSEYFRDPGVVREVWERLAVDGRAQASFAAQRNVIAKRGKDFRDVFAYFGAMNRIAPRWYAEGRSYARFVAAPAGRFTLSKARPGTGWKGTSLSHLSNQHAILRPGQGLGGPWRVRIEVAAPPRLRGSDAGVVVHFTDGRFQYRKVRLTERGRARFTVLFNNRKVSRVALTLTNSSTRIAHCGSATLWTCGGEPVDEDLPFAFRARAFRG